MSKIEDTEKSMENFKDDIRKILKKYNAELTIVDSQGYLAGGTKKSGKFIVPQYRINVELIEKGKFYLLL